MRDDLLASLSPRRRQCLRLLNDGLRAKEIARELRIEETTVRDHLKASREIIGLSDSLAVARMLVDYERRHPQRLGMHPQAVVSADRIAPSANGPGEHPRSGQDISADAVDPVERHRSQAARDDERPRLASLLFPPLDRSPNDLSAREKVRIIGLEVVTIIVGAAGLMGLIILLNWYLAHLYRHGG